MPRKKKSKQLEFDPSFIAWHRSLKEKRGPSRNEIQGALTPFERKDEGKPPPEEEKKEEEKAEEEIVPLPDEGNSLQPRWPVRRFDVFATYNYLKAKIFGINTRNDEGETIHHTFSDEEAMEYGYALAVVVAARKQGAGLNQLRKKPWEKTPKRRANLLDPKVQEQVLKQGKWWKGMSFSHKDFQKNIVDRVGREFYNHVMRPAIEKAVLRGVDYMKIRDTIRKEWNKGWG